MSLIPAHISSKYAILSIMKCGDSLGGRLAALRKAKKLPQIEVAEAIGISRSHLAEIEGGKDPGFRTFCDLAAFFNVSLDYLYRGTPALHADALNDIQKNEEVLMIEFWRSLNSDERKILLGIFSKNMHHTAA